MANGFYLNLLDLFYLWNIKIIQNLLNKEFLSIIKNY